MYTWSGPTIKELAKIHLSCLSRLPDVTIWCRITLSSCWEQPPLCLLIWLQSVGRWTFIVHPWLYLVSMGGSATDTKEEAIWCFRCTHLMKDTWFQNFCCFLLLICFPKGSFTVLLSMEFHIWAWQCRRNSDIFPCAESLQEAVSSMPVAFRW